MFAAPRDGDEWRKQLTSVLRDGAPIVIIDNVVYSLTSPELCKVLTGRVHGDRLLGKTSTLQLPISATFIATGNNVIVRGDMTRRCYWIYLDPRSAAPSMRFDFKHKCLKQHVLQQRAELVGAVLTLARAWYAAGGPDPDCPLMPSFDEWRRTVGGILQHAGVPGFLSNGTSSAAVMDPEAEQIEGFLKMLADAFGSEPFTVSEVWRRMNSSSNAGSLRDYVPESILHLLDREGAFKQGLGQSFARWKDRRFGGSGIHIRRAGADSHSNVSRWEITFGAN
jgi:hypothetical protein